MKVTEDVHEYIADHDISQKEARRIGILSL